MKTSVTPPTTYSEWLKCFSYLKNNRVDGEYIDIIKRGSLQRDEGILLRYENRLINLLNIMIDKKTRKFIGEINLLIECNEIMGLATLFRRFKREIGGCMFFCDLDFLPDNMKNQLRESVKQQIEEFLKQILNHLKIQSVEFNNIQLEEALYEIKRIKMFS